MNTTTIAWPKSEKGRLERSVKSLRLTLKQYYTNPNSNPAERVLVAALLRPQFYNAFVPRTASFVSVRPASRHPSHCQIST